MWSRTAWAHVFPDDTVKTYLDQYAEVRSSTTGLPEVVAAISVADELLGIATLVFDDELPGATEPGPWLAAVYVSPLARRQGVGQAITMWVTARAQMLGFPSIHLYTEDKREWYENLGWRFCRTSAINGLPVSVMELTLSVDAASIYHVSTGQAWSSQTVHYHHPSLDSEGFIHCSTLHQLAVVANSYYQSEDNILVLVISTATLRSELRWEPPRHPDGSTAQSVHLLYPHIYGEINTEAVSEVINWTRDSRGRYRLPSQLVAQ